MMKTIEELSRVTPRQDTILTIGVFDGVHLGHQYLLRRLVQAAARQGSQSCVITFLNSPREVLNPAASVRLIVSPQRRLRLIQKAGVDLVIPITFDLDLAHLRAREFLELLMERVRMRGMVVGPDFALGHRREGDIPTLQRLSQEMGFSLEIVDIQTTGGALVRSTAVRQLVQSGDVAGASHLLGRHFMLEGEVVRGDARGHLLGFPTANLQAAPSQLVPGDGVYATWTHVDGERHPSATNVGLRPTFGAGGDRTVEAFIMDFNQNIYGKHIKLEFVQRLREELRYESVEALQHQIEQDVVDARAALGER